MDMEKLQQMMGGMNFNSEKMQKMNEDAEAKAYLDLSKHIMEMEDEFKDRFKAIRVL